MKQALVEHFQQPFVSCLPRFVLCCPTSKSFVPVVLLFLIPLLKSNLCNNLLPFMRHERFVYVGSLERLCSMLSDCCINIF